MYSSKIREDIIDGCGPWEWPAADRGGWEGPVNDWIKEHKPRILKYAQGFDTVIQAGGCCGLYPRLYATMFRSVYTFEPDPQNFYFLSLNCPQPNIFKFNAALGAIASFTSITERPDGNCGATTVSHDNLPTHLIPVVPLDCFAFHNVDVIHLDVEGFEPEVIQGAAETIDNHRPLILAENANHGRAAGLLVDIHKYRYIENSAADGLFVPGEWI